MSLFSEQEVNSSVYQAATFKEIRLVPNQGAVCYVPDNNINTDRDLFNHKEYLKQERAKGGINRIKAPQISSNSHRTPNQNNEVIDVDNPNQIIEVRKQTFEKPKLVPQRPRFSKIEIPDIKPLKFNDIFSQDISQLLPEVEKFATTMKIATIEEQLSSESFNFYAKLEPRRRLQQTLKDSLILPDLQQKLETHNPFAQLNSDQLFTQKRSLEFAQLQSKLDFVRKSKVSTENFFGLLIGGPEEIEALGEFLVYQLVKKMEVDCEYPYLLYLSLDQMKKKVNTLITGSLLKDEAKLDMSIVYQDMVQGDRVSDFRPSPSGYISIQDINKINQVIRDETDQFGVMLYYGGSAFESQGQYSEKHYYGYLIQNMIIGLKTLQHNGSMILKTQYLVCQSLKNANIPTEIAILTSLYQKIINLQNPKENLLRINFPFDLIDHKILENEEKLRAMVSHSNDSIAVFRESILKNVIEDGQPSQDIINDIKNDLLSKWGLINSSNSINQKFEEHQQRNSGFRPSTNRPNQAGNQSQYKPQNAIQEEPMPFKTASEEEMVRQYTNQNKFTEDFLSEITSTKEKDKQRDQRQKKIELERSREKQKQEDLKKKEAEKLALLKEKLLSSTQAKKKQVAKKPNESAQAQNAAATVQGNKISIPNLSGNQNQSEQQFQQPSHKIEIQKVKQQKANEQLSKRSSKEDEPMTDEISEQKKLKRTRQQAQDEEEEDHYDPFEPNPSKRLKIHHNANNDSQKLQSEMIKPKSLEQKEQQENDETKQKALLEKIQKNKEELERLQKLKFSNPSMLEKLSQGEIESDDFSTLFSIINGGVEYNNVSRIASKFRKPGINDQNGQSLNIQRTFVEETPKINENESPRTKIIKLFRKTEPPKPELSDVEQLDKIKEQMGISSTKLNFDKAQQDSPEVSPRQEQSKNSFFRRIFCMSPKQSSPRVETKQRDFSLPQENKSNQSNLLQIPTGNLEKSNSSLTLRLTPVEIINEEILNPATERSKSHSPQIKTSPKNQSLKQIPPNLRKSKESLIIVNKVDTRDELWIKVERAIKDLSSASVVNPVASERKKSVSKSKSPIRKQIEPDFTREETDQKITEALQMNSMLVKKAYEKKNGSFHTLKKQDSYDNQFLSEFIKSGGSTTNQNIQDTLNESMSIKYKSRTKLDSILSKNPSRTNKNSYASQLTGGTSRNMKKNMSFATVATQNKKLNSSRNNSSAKIQSLKIKSILDSQRSKNISKISVADKFQKLNSDLFHKDGLKTRSKSVIRPSYLNSPYQSTKLLPLIKGQSFINQESHYQQNDNSGTYIDESQLQTALNKYLETEANPRQERTLSNISSKQLIHHNVDLENSMSDLAPSQNNFEDDMQKGIHQILNDQSSPNLNLEEPTVFISILNLMIKHPIFKKMHKNSIRSIIQRGSYLMVLKKNQVLYKEEEESKTVYIPIYGDLQLWSRKSGALGKVTPGFTAGEEALIDPGYICRFDNCFAESECSLICLDEDQWVNLKSEKYDPVFARDLKTLEATFNRNYNQKKGWRSGNNTVKIVQSRKIQNNKYHSIINDI